MNFITSAFSRNDLLSMLPPAELGQLRPLLTRVQLVNGQILYEAGERIEQVFFIEQGFISMVADAAGNSPGTEVGLIGREGMVGLPVLLGSQAVSFNRAMVQMPGTAHRLAAQALRDSADALPVLWRLLLQALEVSMAQVAQTAACSSQHSLAHRLARWLLMAHDRVDGDEVAMTQEFLSIMLAVRRSGVTVALQKLLETGAVRVRRGRVIVCDRAALENAACGCYGRVQAFTAIIAARLPEPPNPASLAA